MYILLTILGLIAIYLIWTCLWKPIILKLHVSILTSLLSDAFEHYKMGTSDADERSFAIAYEMYNRAANTPRDFSFKEFKIILDNMILDKKQRQMRNETDDYMRNLSINFANSMFSCFLLRSPIFAFHVVLMIVFYFIKANTSDQCSYISEKFLRLIKGKNKPQDFIEQGYAVPCKSSHHFA